MAEGIESKHGETRGRLGVAGAGLDRALEIPPDDPLAWNNRGVSRHAQGDTRGALADFDKALEIRPEYPEAYNNRGIARHALGDHAGALADFDRALALRPGYAEALVNRGTTRQVVGDHAGAVTDFDRSIRIRPDYPDAYFGRGLSRHALGALDDAVSDFEETLRLIPHQAAAVVYHSRGAVRVSQKAFRAALADFSQAIAIDPNDCIAYISRANARYHLRDPEGSSDYGTALRLDARAAATEIIRILSVGIREDAASVLENCRRHLRISPDDAIAYARRGLTLILQGREADAAADFEQIRARRSDWAGPLELLIRTARQQSQPGSAVGPGSAGPAREAVLFPDDLDQDPL